MLLTQATLEAIAAGTVTMAFRRWRRPTVRTGGTLLTAIGLLSIDDVSRVALDDLTESDARASGHTDLDALRSKLSKRTAGTLYRIALHRAGPDPRIALRAAVPSSADLESLRSRMVRWDASSSSGPWTQPVLRLLGKHPGVRAAGPGRLAWDGHAAVQGRTYGSSRALVSRRVWRPGTGFPRAGRRSSSTWVGSPHLAEGWSLHVHMRPRPK